MAAEVDPLGTHDRRGLAFRGAQQLSDCSFELRRQLVIGVVAERFVAQASIRRIIHLLLAAPAQVLHPGILNGSFRQLGLKRLAIEPRQPSRHGKRSNVSEYSDAVRLERFDQFFERPGGVADGVDDSHKQSTISISQPSRVRAYCLSLTAYCFILPCACTA